MIQGLCARHEAVVGPRVRGPGGVELGVDVTVDFGFTASLTLSVAVVTAGPHSTVGWDGGFRTGRLGVHIFAAEVAWGGTWRAVLVSAVGNSRCRECVSCGSPVVDVVPGGW